jgi:4-hydroxy-tetrahydrodipicolinate reductase
VISSSEELFYPYKRDDGFCRRIDALCKRHQATVVGTGVNPGFSMDILPVIVSSVCTTYCRCCAPAPAPAKESRCRADAG